MSFEPIRPEVHHPPLKVAEDSWLIQQIQGSGHRTPVGLSELAGDQWARADHSRYRNACQPRAMDGGRFSIVDPGDVRWIFLSHDDVDHSGNLVEIMRACPNATLISTWFMIERHSNAFNFPLERSRWVNDGDSWRAGAEH